MSQYKVKELKNQTGGGAFALYRSLYYGDLPLGRVLLTEFLVTFIGWIPGALGLLLRRLFYPLIFPEIGKKVVFGRNIVIRHPHKIRIGDRVVLDDHCVIDAKGDDNRGIDIGDGVYLGRHTIVYCKNGNIRLGNKVNISSNCQIYSSNDLTVKDGTVVAAYCYFMSGGAYDYKDPTPFCEQSGLCTKGPCSIGADCWIGAGVTVLDGVRVGDRCVIAAGAVVNRDIPDRSVAAGVPARVVKGI